MIRRKACQTLLFVMFSILVSGQGFTTFREIHQNSEDYKSIERKNQIDTLNYLLCKALSIDFWEMSDFVLLDSISNILINQPKRLKIHVGSFYLVSGLAHANIDGILSDSLYHEALYAFKEAEDIDGQIFALNFILTHLYQMQTPKLLIESYSTDIKKLISQTDYTTSKLFGLSHELLYNSYYRKNNNSKRVDSLYVYFLTTFKHTDLLYNDYYNAKTAFAIQYFYLGQDELAIRLLKSVLVGLKGKTRYYYTRLFNLGYVLVASGQAKEGLPYLHQAVQDNLKNINSYNASKLLSNTYECIAEAHAQLGNLDSAYFYSKKSFDAMNEFHIREIDLRRLYGEKRYESHLNRLKIQELDFQVEVERKRKNFILYGLFLILLIAFGVFYSRQKQIHINAQMKNLVKNREMLLKVVVHDLKQPLNNFQHLTGIVAMLLKEQRFEQISSLSDQILKSGEHLNNTINKIIAWGLIKNVNNKLKIENICLKETFADINELYKSLAANKNVTIHENIEKMPLFRTSPLLLTQVIRNLFSNAIKHANENSEVLIQARRVENQLQMTFCNEADYDSYQYVQQIFEGKKKSLKSEIKVEHGLGADIVATSIFRLKATIELEPYLPNKKVSIKVFVNESTE